MIHKTINYDALRRDFEASPFKEHFFGSFDRFLDKIKENQNKVAQNEQEMAIPFQQGSKTFIITFTLSKCGKKYLFESVKHEDGENPMMDPIYELLINKEFKKWLCHVIQKIIHQFKKESLVLV